MSRTDHPAMSDLPFDKHERPSDVPNPGSSLSLRPAVLAAAFVFIGGAGWVVVKQLGDRKSETSLPNPSTTVSTPGTNTRVSETVIEAANTASAPTIPVPSDTTAFNLPAVTNPVSRETPAPTDLQRLTVATIEKTRDRLQSLEARIEDLHASWSPLADDMVDIQARLTGLDQRQAKQAAPPQPADNERLTTLRKDVETLVGRIDALSQQITLTQRQGRRATRTAKSPPLPFTGEAIDWWDGQPSLVVRTGEQWRFLSPGQAVAGWRLAEIDDSADRALFVREGQRVRLEIEQ